MNNFFLDKCPFDVTNWDTVANRRSIGKSPSASQSFIVGWK